MSFSFRLLALVLFGSCLPAATVFPPVNLGTAAVSATSPGSALNFTFSSQGAQPVFSLLYGGEFNLGTVTCNGGSTVCTVQATFTPKYPGLRTDVVIARDSANNLLGKLPVSGTGTGPQASLAPGATTQILPGGGFYSIPQMLVLDPAGNGYAVVSESNQIFKLSAVDQSFTVIAGSTTAGYSGDGGAAINAQFSRPNALALDRAGNLFVADENNNVIRKIDLATEL